MCCYIHGVGYRDEKLATRQRIRILVDDLCRKRAALSEELIALLPNDIAEKVRRAPTLLEQDFESTERLHALDELSAAFDRIGVLLPDIERRVHALPTDFCAGTQTRLPDFEVHGDLLFKRPWTQKKRPPGKPWFSVHKHLRYYIDVAASGPVQAIEAKYNFMQAKGEEYDRWHYLARFRAGGVPVTFESWGKVAYSVPVRASIPDLFLRSETWSDSIAKRFFGRRDADVGDRDFDDRFLVDAAPATARQLLSAKVREHIMTICHFDEPLINIENGVCRIVYQSDGAEDIFNATLAILRYVHRADFDVPLRV